MTYSYINFFGDKISHNSNGQLHTGNDDFSPIIWKNGNKGWYANGKHHRLGGFPAYEYYDGTKAWYIYGKRYTYEQVINSYKILTRFGRYCLKKIRMRKSE
jgi:hypothetical protein